MMESKVKFFFLFSWFETERFPHVLVLGSCYLVRLKLFWRWFVSYEALHPIKQEVLFSCLDSSNKAKKNPIFLFFFMHKNVQCVTQNWKLSAAIYVQSYKPITEFARLLVCTWSINMGILFIVLTLLLSFVLQDCFHPYLVISCCFCTCQILYTCSINSLGSLCMTQYIKLIYDFYVTVYYVVYVKYKNCIISRYINSNSYTSLWAVGTISRHSGDAIACCVWTTTLYISWRQLW